MKTKQLTILTMSCSLLLMSCNEASFDTNANITCYTRDTTSGTRDGFFTKIGLEEAKDKNEPLVSRIVEASSNDDIL
ncbi:MAG: hypothetical protein MR270_01265 [Erysipelotrichaceae bacterium]|nr:hypothetical protein [Erysipelotrichaceae bacterium]